jgi:cell division septation protein DedD
MSSEIRPEDIEAAIAAAEQRRRARMGGGGGGVDVATAPTPAARRPAVPERVVAGAATAEASVRETAKPGASGHASDDLDDSWLDQPAKPRPPLGRRMADLPESEVVWEPETSRRGLALPFGIAAVALLVFGSILWWAYSSDGEQGGGEVPIIVAEDTPIKEKPAEEGGLEVPDQDKLVYNSIAEGEEQTSGVEQLLPAPEEPVTPPQPEPAVAAVSAAQPAPHPLSEEDTAAALADVAPAPTLTPAEPVQTAAAPAPAAPAAPAPAAPVAAAPAEPAAPAATQQAAAPAAAAPVEPVQPSAGGGWKIQLAAVKSEEGARQEWGRMQSVHPDLLGDMRLTVQKADLGTKGIYYRIQAGPLPDRTTAEDVCAELKASKQPCLVVKP